MRDLIAVLTCPLPTTTPRYLRQTLENLDKQGADLADKLVFSDGALFADVIHTYEGRPWPVICREGPSGAVRGLWSLFRYALENEIERLLLFEDDVLPCKNAVVRMLLQDIPGDVGLVSFFDMAVWRGRERHDGLHRIELSPDRNKLWSYWIAGHQACLIPRRTIKFYVDNFDERLVNPKAQASDMLMSEMLLGSRVPRYALHIPCLVEHVGANYSRVYDSEVPAANIRTATCFPGYDFDALSLPTYS